jgi:hypothetical protein
VPRKRNPPVDDRPLVNELERLNRFGDLALQNPELGQEEIIPQRERPLVADNPFSLSEEEIEEIIKSSGGDDLRPATKNKLIGQIKQLKEEYKPEGQVQLPAQIKKWIERFYRFFSDRELAELVGCNISSIGKLRKTHKLIKKDERISKDSVAKQLVRLGRTGVPGKISDKIVEYKKSTRYYKQREVLTNDEWAWFDDQFTEMVADLCDEGDLTRQEINAVIDLCLEYLNQFRLNKRIRLLTQIEAEGIDNLEERKLVENSFNNSIDRSQKMLRDLKATRRQRLDKSQPRKLSIVDLVEAWKKEETKGFLLQRAKLAQEQLQTEFERLKNPRIGMAMILGYDPTKRIIDVDEEFKDED